MSDRDQGGGLFGFIGAILAVIGALTVAAVAAIAVSVLAWEMELRRSEELETAAAPQPPTTPSA